MAKEKYIPSEKPTVSIVGAGRLGGALALALTSRGYFIEGLLARKSSHARRMARLLQHQPVALSETQFARLPASDLTLIATPDDAINDTARKIASVQGKVGGARTVLHTSGALSSQALAPLAAAGFSTGSLHPLVSISDAAGGAARLQGAFYCLEGDRSARRMARRLVRDLGGHGFSIAPRNKTLYHAAAVMASGHATALFDVALEMLGRCGLSQMRARAVLLPLVQSTFANLAVMEPAEALTGTFARGDVDTVHKHLTILAQQRLQEPLAVYLLLGRRSLSLARAAAKRKRIKVDSLDQILKVLELWERRPADK